MKNEIEILKNEIARIMNKYSVTTEMFIESIKSGKFEKFIKSLIKKEK